MINRIKKYQNIISQTFFGFLFFALIIGIAFALSSFIIMISKLPSLFIIFTIGLVLILSYLIGIDLTGGKE
jgi:hypothetical protein